VTNYDLESRVVYPGQLFEDRRREIAQCQVVAETMGSLLQSPDATAIGVWDVLLTRIAYHTDNQPATPYREALVQLKRRIETAKRGDNVAIEGTDANLSESEAVIDQPAPDFVATDLTSHESFRLKRLAGRPALLLFYSPASKTAEESLRLAQSLSDSFGKSLHVVSLSVTDDVQRVLKQRQQLAVTFPVVSGVGLKRSYNVEATPRWVIIDASGFVRAAFTGWGDEVPSLVREELRQRVAPPAEKKEESIPAKRGK
jgi:peroxiredoxin